MLLALMMIMTMVMMTLNERVDDHLMTMAMTMMMKSLKWLGKQTACQ